MKKLHDFIKGLQIIAEVEKNSKEFRFLWQECFIYIGNVDLYSENQKKELNDLGFEINFCRNHFDYDLS